MPMTNDERAEHAGAAIAEYLSSKGEPHDQPAEEYEISDLICDLLHHGDRLGFDHKAILDRATMHYEEEKAEEIAPEHGAALLRAAEGVLDAWDSGNLAAAVRALAESVRIARGRT